MHNIVHIDDDKWNMWCVPANIIMWKHGRRHLLSSFDHVRCCKSSNQKTWHIFWFYICIHKSDIKMVDLFGQNEKWQTTRVVRPARCPDVAAYMAMAVISSGARFACARICCVTVSTGRFLLIGSTPSIGCFHMVSHVLLFSLSLPDQWSHTHTQALHDLSISFSFWECAFILPFFPSLTAYALDRRWSADTFCQFVHNK